MNIVLHTLEDRDIECTLCHSDTKPLNGSGSPSLSANNFHRLDEEDRECKQHERVGQKNLRSYENKNAEEKSVKRH